MHTRLLSTGKERSLLNGMRKVKADQRLKGILAALKTVPESSEISAEKTIKPDKKILKPEVLSLIDGLTR